MTKPLLEVKNLSIKYPIWGGILRHKVNEVCAVDDVSFKINVGETLGLVGESGCGKTTVAKSIVNIHRAMTPGVAQDGEIIFHADEGPINVLDLNRSQMRSDSLVAYGVVQPRLMSRVTFLPVCHKALKGQRGAATDCQNDRLPD